MKQLTSSDVRWILCLRIPRWEVEENWRGVKEKGKTKRQDIRGRMKLQKSSHARLANPSRQISEKIYMFKVYSTRLDHSLQCLVGYIHGD